MTGLAFGLVLVSAVMHASWNFLAKRVGGGMAVVWLFSAISALIYLPLVIAILLIQKPVMGGFEILFLVGTVVLHILYYFLLTRGYRAGDLSMVYPLARGTGPVLSVIGAIILLGERPMPGVVFGAILVGLGVFIIMGNPFALRANSAAIGYGLLCGLSIAAYTLVDKQAVSALMISPVLLTWFSSAAQGILLLPVARREWDVVRRAWNEHRREVIGIGVLDSLSYILFLIALTFSDVSLLAPLRQTSILIGAFMGVRLLSEDASRRRLIATGVMLFGLLALTLG